MPSFIDLTGQLFGRLTAKELLPVRGRRGAKWRCSCHCGGEIVTYACNLRTGKSWHCGCVDSREKYSWVDTPEYRAWHNIKERCFNPAHEAYMNYGGRGITMFPEWIDDFPAFLAHVGPRPVEKERYSIERKDNNKGYEPGNLKWATYTEQMRNKRSNRFLTFEGETLTLIEWSHKLGINQTTISERLAMGWSVERTLSSKTRKAKLLTHRGVTKTIQEWADHLGMTIEAMLYRLSKGWEGDKLFMPKQPTTEVNTTAEKPL